jgi:hypothetical protein
MSAAQELLHHVGGGQAARGLDLSAPVQLCSMENLHRFKVELRTALIFMHPGMVSILQEQWHLFRCTACNAVLYCALGQNLLNPAGVCMQSMGAWVQRGMWHVHEKPMHACPAHAGPEPSHSTKPAGGPASG